MKIIFEGNRYLWGEVPFWKEMGVEQVASIYNGTGPGQISWPAIPPSADSAQPSKTKVQSATVNRIVRTGQLQEEAHNPMTYDGALVLDCETQGWGVQTESQWTTTLPKMLTQLAWIGEVAPVAKTSFYHHSAPFLGVNADQGRENARLDFCNDIGWFTASKVLIPQFRAYSERMTTWADYVERCIGKLRSRTSTPIYAFLDPEFGNNAEGGIEFDKIPQPFFAFMLDHLTTLRVDGIYIWNAGETSKFDFQWPWFLALKDYLSKMAPPIPVPAPDPCKEWKDLVGVANAERDTALLMRDDAINKTNRLRDGLRDLIDQTS